MSESPKQKSLGQKIFRILSGYEIALICLIKLFLLTFFGTLEQSWLGLWGAIDKYFDYDTFIVLPQRGDGKIIFLPLLSAYWVIVILSINMFLGGIVRARKGWKKAGVLLSHFAILFMLIAGGVSSVTKEEGHMAVMEGEWSDFALTLLKHDIEVFAYDEKGSRKAPAIIRSEEIEDLGKEDTLKATFNDHSFTMEVDSRLPYTELMRVGPSRTPDESEEVVDGFFLREIEKDVKVEEKNNPGCLVSVKDQSGELIQRLILWAGNPYPVTFEHEGVRYGVTYLNPVWPMPFQVELRRAVGEYHPGTEIPRWFQSDITKVSKGSREDYEIVMNKPARHDGYTLYQAKYGGSGNGIPANSTFAIVKNPSDKWPEYALWLSAAGLTFHFLFMLYQFIDRGTVSRKSQTTKPSDS